MGKSPKASPHISPSSSANLNESSQENVNPNQNLNANFNLGTPISNQQKQQEQLISILTHNQGVGGGVAGGSNQFSDKENVCKKAKTGNTGGTSSGIASAMASAMASSAMAMTMVSSSSPTSSTSSTPQKTCSGAGANGLGTIIFKIRYKEDNSALTVTIVRCESLRVKESNSCDPYIKLQLLPEKQRVKTRVLRHTRQPVFDEDFTFFGIKPQQLDTISLHFVVLHFDRYSRDDVIGEVVFPLSSIEMITDNKHVEVEREIQPRNLKMKAEGRGEVLASLSWQPANRKLTCVILKARGLPKMDVSGMADPYIKLYLLYNGQRIAKKKTHIKKRTLNPVYNESFIFDVPAAAIENLDKLSLHLLLLDWDRVTKNEVIGRIELGEGATSESAIEHWNEVIQCPRRQIAEWHKLT